VNYFPVFFDLTGQRVLIVGGGEVALRKVSLLERTGAVITLVAPEIAPELRERAAAGKLQLVIREFAADDLDGARLVIVATSRRAVNRWIANLSESRNIPVNVVDDREASRFIVPAIIDRDPVLVAISTGGTSPVLARRLRERLEALIPKRIGELASWLQALRGATRQKLRDTDQRRRFFEAVVDGPAARRFVEGDQSGAQRIAQQLLATTSAAPRAAGEVTLVGAGPGDPELLTLKALRALQDADVILHDRLVPAAVLDLARRDATQICVGKAAGHIGSTQEEINALLIEHANQGKRVVRLKGGDPFVFGRGGEELQALAKARINFSVVPGITAALGVAAYAGIPLTHRDYAHSVTFVTGQHQGDGPDGPRAPGSHRGKAAGARRRGHAPGRHHCAGHDARPARHYRHSRHHSRCLIWRESGIAGAAGGGRRRSLALDAGLVRHHRGSRPVSDGMNWIARNRRTGQYRARPLADGFDKPALRNPGLIEQARLVLRSAVAQNCDDGMARAELLRERHRRRHIDARRASEQQALFAHQPINKVHGLCIRDSQRIVDRGALEIRGHAAGADTLGDG
jgi:uroporphyrin-III C-methyltransferase / precorrin-2 dehydrogenase / sirohydrochlorin ferrochelatase